MIITNIGKVAVEKGWSFTRIEYCEQELPRTLHIGSIKNINPKVT